LNLTEEQSAKLKKSREEMQQKLKSIKENKALSDEQKKEQVKEAMKKQRESMQSVLTDEQKAKMKADRKHRPAKRMKRPAPKDKEVI